MIAEYLQGARCARLASEQGSMAVIGFYYPGRPTPADSFCGAGILGNFWLTPVELDGKRFTNAESAFQALKWWDAHSSSFEKLDGEAAFRLKRKLETNSAF